MIDFPSRSYTRAAAEVLTVLDGALAPTRLEYAEDLLAQGEPDLAVEAAARMVIEDQVALSAWCAERLLELLAPTPWAEHVSPEALRALVA